MEFDGEKIFTNFCGALVIFHEVMNLECLQLDVSEVILVNFLNISCLIFWIFLLILSRKKVLQSLIGVTVIVAKTGNHLIFTWDRVRKTERLVMVLAFRNSVIPLSKT